VTANGRLTGMVTDRDIAIRVIADGKDCEGDDTQTGQVVQEISQ
jgi:CBS domain-containing protein